jgi:hypothetical protein
MRTLSPCCGQLSHAADASMCARTCAAGRKTNAASPASAVELRAARYSSRQRVLPTLLASGGHARAALQCIAARHAACYTLYDVRWRLQDEARPWFTRDFALRAPPEQPKMCELRRNVHAHILACRQVAACGTALCILRTVQPLCGTHTSSHIPSTPPATRLPPARPPSPSARPPARSLRTHRSTVICWRCRGTAGRHRQQQQRRTTAHLWPAPRRRRIGPL